MEVKRWTYASALMPASELDVQSGRMKTFVYASRSNVPDLMVVREGATVTTYRFATDHLGSVRMVVNASCPQTIADAYASCVVWHADYDEYGRRNGPLLKGDENLHSFGFAGGLFDYETGLTRFGARDYDPYTGRWTARDPILFDGGSSNLYAYCDNDPVNCIDPSGESAVGAALPAAGGLAAADGPAPFGDAAAICLLTGAVLLDAWDLITEARSRGERGQTRPGGNDSPWKKTKPHPTDPTKIIEKDNQTGKDKVKPKPPGWDEWWNSK